MDKISKNIKAYLFDWGDTLMVDYPDAKGKMCDWDVVNTVNEAEKALKCLSQTAKIYIATGAKNSSETDIKNAFKRVDLDQYISGYFSQTTTGFSKGTPEFLEYILKQIDIEASNASMVGDTYEMDIEPALKIGMTAIWFTQQNSIPHKENLFIISKLSELC